MTPIKSSILYLCLLVSMALLLIFFVVTPLVQNVRQNKKMLADKQALFISQEEKASLLKNMQKNPEVLKNKVGVIDSLWPNDKEVSSFIVDIENLANAKGITIKNVAISENVISKEKSKTKRSSIQFSFDIKTDFDKDMAMIKSLEKFVRFNNLRQLNFSKDEEGLVSMKVTGLIYYGE